MDYSGSFILQPNRQIKVFNTNTPAGEFEIKFDMDNSQPSLSKFVIITGNKTSNTRLPVRLKVTFPVLSIPDSILPGN